MQPRSPEPAKAPAVQPKTLAGVIGSVAAAAALFVLIPKEESGRTVTATVNADQSITVKHVAGKQYLSTYLDIVGVPTACDGITGPDIRMGARFTEEQCAAMLNKQLIAHSEPLIKCIPKLYGRTNQVIPAVSLSYLVGPAGVCKSSIARLWNAGQWRAGCERFPLFNKARGVVRKGLVDRQARARVICLRGLPA